MKKLNELYKKLEEENIRCFDYKIKPCGAVTIEIQDNYAIFANFSSFKTQGQEFSVLAHEYGHCISGTTHSMNVPYETVARGEYRANKSAVLEFLPLSVLMDCFDKGLRTLWQLSEYFNLPEDFIAKAIEIYRKVGLLN